MTRCGAFGFSTQEQEMANVKFPYKGWVLTPAFKPVEKTFVKQETLYEGWHRDEGGKAYNINSIGHDQAAAIARGREMLDKQQAALDKKLANIEKRRAALDKASA
ncbi:hypothetical protein [uncultured Delftia sp.]|jgi:hypothetical protein|uniref:hypothetical protein n=1 Tax=uncultured Delftia sp. TaxID=191464 RepID=UPI00259A4A86|nr:hypothetical protein [uncultured Delftia sp.]